MIGTRVAETILASGLEKDHRSTGRTYRTQDDPITHQKALVPRGPVQVVTPHLVVDDGNAALEFYKKALGATEGDADAGARTASG